MSLRVLASSLVAVAVTVCLLCGAWALGSLPVADADVPGSSEPVAAVVYGDLEGPADSAIRGEQADPEDADSIAASRDAHVIATSISIALIFTERARPIRPDRPPRLALLG
jgi:hypothetical protein